MSLRRRFAVLKRDEYRCQLCGRSAQNTPDLILEIDHKIPRAKGGPDTLSNLWALCFDCNRGKSDSSLDESANGQLTEAYNRTVAQQRRAKLAQSKDPHPNHFRRLREAKGLTRPGLADKAGLKIETIVALETDKPCYERIFLPDLFNALESNEVGKALEAYNAVVMPALIAKSNAKKARKSNLALLRRMSRSSKSRKRTVRR